MTPAFTAMLLWRGKWMAGEQAGCTYIMCKLLTPPKSLTESNRPLINRTDSTSTISGNSSFKHRSCGFGGRMTMIKGTFPVKDQKPIPM